MPVCAGMRACMCVMRFSASECVYVSVRVIVGLCVCACVYLCVCVCVYTVCVLHQSTPRLLLCF